MAKTLEKSCQQISQALVSQWVSCETSRFGTFKSKTTNFQGKSIERWFQIYLHHCHRRKDHPHHFCFSRSSSISSTSSGDSSGSDPDYQHMDPDMKALMKWASHFFNDNRNSQAKRSFNFLDWKKKYRDEKLRGIIFRANKRKKSSVMGPPLSDEPTGEPTADQV